VEHARSSWTVVPHAIGANQRRRRRCRAPELAKAGPNVMGSLTKGSTRVIVDPLGAVEQDSRRLQGGDWKETGYIFAPYVALALKTFINPETMEPVKSLMTRFGRHTISGDFYATVTITN
jgi:hypothetical protein